MKKSFLISAIFECYFSKNFPAFLKFFMMSRAASKSVSVVVPARALIRNKKTVNKSINVNKNDESNGADNEFAFKLNLAIALLPTVQFKCK
jgi:hypothetical protein